MSHAEADDKSGVIAVGESAEGEGEEVGEMGEDEERDEGHGGEGESGGGEGCLEMEDAEDGVDEGKGDGDGGGEIVESLCQWFVWGGCQSRHESDRSTAHLGCERRPTRSKC